MLTNSGKKIIVLNVLEIKTLAQNNADAEVLLTFCASNEVGSVLAKDEISLQRKLNIKYIPRHLYNKGYLQYKPPGNIVSYFSIHEPQCYMINSSWLTYNVSSKVKSDYLHILGQRSITNKKRFIPDYYIDQVYWKNPLICHVDRKIKFILEK
jgi:hypothetical protein